MNNKFKYCPSCGRIYDLNTTNKGCFYCSKLSNKIKITTSNNNYLYYISLSLNKYKDRTYWRKIFYEEELFCNPYFNKEKFIESQNPSYFHYCPVCGTNYNNSKINICGQCGNHIELTKSTHDREYYRDRSIALYGDYKHWHAILIEEEVSKNPLFDITKTEQNSPPAVVPIKPCSPEPNVPKCPTCGSTNIKRISSLSRATHGFAFGLLSKTARSQFECKNCRYKW